MSTSSASPTETSSRSASSSTSTSTSSRGSGDVSPSSGSRSELETSQGTTTIADAVVAKIAGMAAREVTGVHKMGAGGARAMGALRDRLPGSSSTSGVTQGVNVEVGQTQAAVDIDVVVEYGVTIVDLAAGIRRNVISSIESMTGLQVTEVNVAVDDVHLPDEDSGDDSGDSGDSGERSSQPERSRVQ